MKILMTTDTVGGVWTYSLELCRALQEYAVEVHLAAMGAWPSKEQEKEVATIENVILYKSDYKLEWMSDPWEDVQKARKWITSIYQTMHPDVVHFNNYAQIENFWNCPVITAYHSCVQTWWQAVKGTTAPSTWNKYTRLVRESLNQSDVVVGPTKSILEKAIDVHKIESETKVIYNGRDLEFAEVQEKEDIILCMGRIWDEAKNLKLLSGIAKNLPWPVYVAGSNINPDTGIKVEIENIHFLGELSSKEASEWMQRAAIFASPTKYEPFGLAILEAAKAGCALALSNIETLQEIWSERAAFFDPQNPQETQEKIIRLVEDADYRKELSERSRRRGTFFTSRKMGQEYMDVYQKMMSGKQKETNQLSHNV